MINVISGRVKVNLLRADLAKQETFDEVVLSKIEEHASSLGESLVWLEVQYLDQLTADWENWDESGDAVEVSFVDDTVSIRTLTSEEWAGASK